MVRKGLFFIFLLPLFLGMISKSASVDTLFRVKPYLQLFGKGEIQITWFADQLLSSSIKVKDGSGTVIWESEVVGELVPEIYYTSQEKNQLIGGLSQGSWLYGDQTYRYRVALPELEAGKSLSYEVSLSSETFRSDFKTKPAQDWENIRFIALSDSETEPRGRDRHRPWAPGTPLLRPFGLTVPDLWKEKFGFITQSGIEIPHYLLSETQGYAENLKVIKSRNPDFIVMPGDLTQGGGYQPAWDEFFRHNAGEFDEVLSKSAIIPALGNWENYGGISGGYQYNERGEFAPKVGRMRFHAYFETPEEDPLKKHRQSYYRVDYGPVTILTLDSSNGTPDQSASDFSEEEKISGKELTELGTDTQENFTAAEYQANGGTDLSGFAPGSDQYVWLEENLKQASESGQLIFVQYHHIAYSSGEHGVPLNHELAIGQSGVPMRILNPLLEEYGVIAVLSGHDEIFERSFVDEDGDGKGILYYDVGVAGDGIFGVKRDYDAFLFPKVDYNPYKAWTADENSTETWNTSGSNPVPTDGGKHYGHLEVNVVKLKDGDKTFARIDFTPVYVFPIMDDSYTLQSVERRVYNDEVSITVELKEAVVVIEPQFKESIRVELNEAGIVETVLSDYLENEVQEDWEVVYSRSTTYTCSDLSGTENELKISDSKGNTWTKVVKVEVVDTIAPDFEATDANLAFDKTIGSVVIDPESFYIRTEFIYENCLNTYPVNVVLSKTEITCADFNSDGTFDPIAVDITLSDQSGNQTTKTRKVNLNIIESKKVSLTALDQLIEGGEIELRLGEELEYEVLAWYRYGQLLEGIKGSSIIVEDPGFYQADLQLLNGCIVKSDALTLEQGEFIFPELKSELILDLDENGRAELEPSSLFLTWPLPNTEWTVTLSKSVFSCGESGDQEIEVKIIDESDRVWTKTTSVEVLDRIAPKLEVQNISLDLDVTLGILALNPDELIASVSDNCGIASKSISKSQITCEDLGKTLEILVLVEDISGNPTERIAKVSVNRLESNPLQLEGDSQICEGSSTLLQINSDQNFEVLEWRRNGQKIEAQTGQSLEANEAGIYQALIRYEGACLSETSNFELTLIPLPEGEIVQEGSKLFAPEGAAKYQWYRNEEMLEGETSSTLELNQMGSYEVVIENEEGCSRRLSAIEVTISGLLSRLDVLDLLVYPNPGRDRIQVKLSTDSGLNIDQVELYSIDGKYLTNNILIIKNSGSEMELEVEKLSAGMYLIWVLDEGGKSHLGRFSKVNF
ncbi:Por secretion system C-terminal sorting domain-containing protein [Algoriphagus faecimaris]|uniref:Por secretion system C-terminal sorting domain-containing protein n=1 Tax=Algoriphagus faecimaris TaxID=686796 RepID=A0A1G6T2H6_9BACT|nr:T9SS type A sorting domain-containing protein [Algoriphagus faecimaris]SDD22687.1 Por secretion system C-terminal sorting domain-containing protein [Algoriphagus faecimaris]